MASDRTVMVVEDDAASRKALSQIAEFVGYEVKTAENGQEALDDLHQDDCHPCLILLDLMMPVMDGWQFLEEKEHDPALADIPVVVVSAAHDLPSGTAGALHKPLDLDELVTTLQQYC